MSKDVDIREYCLSDWDFGLNEKRFKSSFVDYFVSHRMWRLRPFCVKFGNSQSMGKDAFALNWSEGLGIFHPSVSDITKVVWRAEKLKVRGMLLIPDFCMLVERRIWKGDDKVDEMEAKDDMYSGDFE